jgi:hypothetical protein
MRLVSVDPEIPVDPDFEICEAYQTPGAAAPVHGPADRGASRLKRLCALIPSPRKTRGLAGGGN